jgi:RNA polymerase sigma-70 factor (ECF subfamily)
MVGRTNTAMASTHDVEALWRESSAKLLAYFEKRTRSRADAEDLLQETFLRVHERLGTLADAASGHGWLRSIARNALVDHLRRRAAGPSPTSLEAEPPEPEGDAENLDRVVAGWLESFLRELDPADAQALREVDLQGSNQREWGESAGLSHSGAKSRVQRARAKLRERLEACCTIAQDTRGNIVGARRRSDGRCAEGCGDEH